MSTESVELVRECFEAYRRGDTQSALAAFDPHVEFDMTIRPDGQVFRGPDGVSEAMRLWNAAFAELRLQADEFLEIDDHRVLITGKQFGRARGSGLELSRPFFHLVTVGDAKIVHWKAFADRDDALKTAGLD